MDARASECEAAKTFDAAAHFWRQLFANAAIASSRVAA
jgi:hypothetical protein